MYCKYIVQLTLIINILYFIRHIRNLKYHPCYFLYMFNFYKVIRETFYYIKLIIDL